MRRQDELMERIGGRGVKGKILDFFCFNICCSPSYEDSKMGSHSFQFFSVVVSWRLAWGPYAQKLDVYTGKIAQNIPKVHLKKLTSPGNKAQNSWKLVHVILVGKLKKWCRNFDFFFSIFGAQSPKKMKNSVFRRPLPCVSSLNNTRCSNMEISFSQSRRQAHTHTHTYMYKNVRAHCVAVYVIVYVGMDNDYFDLTSIACSINRNATLPY